MALHCCDWSKFCLCQPVTLECFESSGDIFSYTVLDVLRHLELAMHFDQLINLHVSITVLLVFISGKLLFDCFCQQHFLEEV